MEEVIAQLKPRTHVRLYKKGSTILFQGEIPRRAYIVREGVVRVYTIKATGEQMIVGFFSEGDMFPLPWLFNTSKKTLFYYESLTDTRLLSFTKDDLAEVTTKSPAAYEVLLQHLSKQYTSQLVHVTALGQSRAIEKISFTLYYLLFQYGVEEKPGVYHFSIKLSHLTLANLTGLTRESTTSNLKILKEKGVITYSHSAFSVDKRKLENFIGEDGFRELSL